MSRPSTDHCLASGTCEPKFASLAAIAAFVLFAALMVVDTPLFLCMPLTTDADMYDIQAHLLLNGGILYRDVLEPNLPGIVWLHAAIRSTLGESSVSLRSVDLIIFLLILGLVARWLRGNGKGYAAQMAIATVLALYYFSISEWNHCQRDTWLLLPALLGLHFRNRQCRRCTRGDARPAEIFRWAFLEGACWGMGVWLKPQIVVPAFCIWAISASQFKKLRAILTDLAGLLAGGLLIGAAGISALWLTGSWPYFWETFWEWNPRYVAAGRANWTEFRFLAMVYRFFPWYLLHLAAVPSAFCSLWFGYRDRKSREAPEQREYRVRRMLFAALYLGWLLQVFLLQHLFDYIHAPTVVLAIVVLAGSRGRHWRSLSWKLAAAAFLVVACSLSPALRPSRIACWPDCFVEGSSPRIRNQLSHFEFPDWADMEQAAAYVNDLGLHDRELTCFGGSLVHFYRRFDLAPPTRFVYLDSMLMFFPEQRAEILADVQRSPQRYVVADMMTTGLPADMLLATSPTEPSLPPGFPESLRREYPWNLPVVFRAGTVLVLRVPRPKDRSAHEQEVAR